MILKMQYWPKLIVFSCFILSNVFSDDQTSYGGDQTIFGINRKNEEKERSLINKDNEIRKGSDDYEKYSYNDVHKDGWSTFNDGQNTNETKEEDDSSIFKKSFGYRNKKPNVKVIKDYLELIIKDLRHHINHLNQLTYLNDIEIMEEKAPSKRDFNIGSNINNDDTDTDDHSNSIGKDNLIHGIFSSIYINRNISNKNFTNASINENTDKKIRINNFLPKKPNQNITVFYESSDDNGFKLNYTNLNNFKLLEVKLQHLYQQLTFIKMAKLSPKDFRKVNCSKKCHSNLEEEKNNRTLLKLPSTFGNENVDKLIHALTEGISGGVINSFYKQGWNVTNKEAQVDTIQAVRESINKLTEQYFMKKRADWISSLKEKWSAKPKTKILEKLKNRFTHRNNERVDNKSELTGASNKVNNHSIILQNNSNVDKNSVEISKTSTNLSFQKELPRSVIEKRLFLMKEEKIDNGSKIGDEFKTKDAFSKTSNSFHASQLQKSSKLQANEDSLSRNSENQRFIKRLLKDYMTNLRKIMQEKKPR